MNRRQRAQAKAVAQQRTADAAIHALGVTLAVGVLVTALIAAL